MDKFTYIVLSGQLSGSKLGRILRKYMGFWVSQGSALLLMKTVPISSHSCFKPCSPAPSQHQIPIYLLHFRNWGTYNPEQKEYICGVFFPQGNWMYELTAALVPSRATGQVMGVMQQWHHHIFRQVAAFKPWTKPTQFPSYIIEKSWGPSLTSKGNFFSFLALGMCQLSLQAVCSYSQKHRMNRKKQYGKGISNEDSYLCMLDEGWARKGLNYFTIPR